MKSNHKHKALTFGDFIAGIYEVCGQHQAKGMVRLALKTHLVEFCGQQRFAISSRLQHPGPKT